MKKIVLLFLVILMSVGANAQNYKNDGKPYDFYCVVECYKGFTASLKFLINWDKQRNETLVDEKGQKVEFLTYVELFNYMSKRGWEYVDVFVHGNQIYAYIFKKKVTNDSEAKEGLFFECDFKGK